MKTRCFLFSMLLVAYALPARGAWRLTSTQESAAAPWARHVRVMARESDTGERAQLHLAIFDTGKISLRIVDQPNESRTDLANVMSANNFLAGINGGYFEANYQPVGLLISGGRTIAPFRRARLLSGVLSVANGQVRLQRVSEFSRKGKIAEAIQCGPFLVDHTRIVPGLETSQSARRTFVAMGNDNQIALGYCSSLSLAQLGEVLSSGKITDDFRVERALNLDGGSSSAFWFRGGDKPFSISELKTVRDFVAVEAK